jgi:hypothetical protein
VAQGAFDDDDAEAMQFFLLRRIKEKRKRKVIPYIYCVKAWVEAQKKNRTRKKSIH